MTHAPVFIPGNMEECFEFGWRAFDVAERLQTLVFGLATWIWDEPRGPAKDLIS
ncbi:MAG: hypothetical protein Ct9H90mP16_18990 [Candidatus Poseidoniales archaeon]|nr:MAG: hypothetical protein Ct9H90mP16_18990 [Candidatus Poseidoniales archaeon]